MLIRPAVAADLDLIDEIDGVIESVDYLHIDRGGEGPAISWKLDRRPLREKLIAPNRFDDDTQFVLKQILTGMDDGIATVAEHDGQVTASLFAQHRPQHETIELIDLRVDYDFRRQGLATVMLFQLIERAREQEGVRAISCTTLTNNYPAAQLLDKHGWELSGLDVRRRSNHDLVKESATLVWYYEIV
jgi:RimJ/RimL family protein N-acetyltransferase